MAIFVDSSDIRGIERLHRMGIIRGVTTNPTIMLKEGVTGGEQGVRDHCRRIAELVDPYPVSVEVMTNDPTETIEQATRFAAIAPNVIVKVTIHGPSGELENLQVIHELETVRDIRVNVTAMMSSQQCYLAACAGASFVSLFGGRVNNMGYNCIDEIRRTRRLLDREALDSRIIVGSTREILNVVEWLDAGADIVTAVPKLIEGMLIHPYSKETVQMFLNDAADLALSKDDGLTSPRLRPG